MRDPLLMHEAEGAHELAAEVASLGFLQAAPESNEVEKLAASHQLKHDVVNKFAAFLRIDLVTTISLDKAYNVTM